MNWVSFLLGAFAGWYVPGAWVFGSSAGKHARDLTNGPARMLFWVIVVPASLLWPVSALWVQWARHVTRRNEKSSPNPGNPG